MLRQTLKLSLLALGLAAAAPLSAQQPPQRAPRPMREWVAERPGRFAAVNGPRRRHRHRAHRRHDRRRMQVRAERVRAYRGWRQL